MRPTRRPISWRASRIELLQGLSPEQVAQALRAAAPAQVAYEDCQFSYSFCVQSTDWELSGVQFDNVLTLNRAAPCDAA